MVPALPLPDATPDMSNVLTNNPHIVIARPPRRIRTPKLPAEPAAVIVGREGRATAGAGSGPGGGRGAAVCGRDGQVEEGAEVAQSAARVPSLPELDCLIFQERCLSF